MPIKARLGGVLDFSPLCGELLIAKTDGKFGSDDVTRDISLKVRSQNRALISSTVYC